VGKQHTCLHLTLEAFAELSLPAFNYQLKANSCAAF